MALILDGKKLAELYSQPMRERAAVFKQVQGRNPCLCIVLVGNNPASITYIEAKEKAAARIGIDTRLNQLTENSSAEEVARILSKLSADDYVDSIILQLPLPKHLRDVTSQLLKLIAPEKDADGLNPINQGSLLTTGSKALTACTPRAIIELLKVAELGYFPKQVAELKELNLSGKNALVIGRSNLVGRPVAELLVSANATVTIAHSRTKDIKEICLKSEIVIAAVGSPHLVTSSWISENTTVVDVGINRGEDGKLCGDVDYGNVVSRAKAITPVPGGVGPMTVCMLLDNVIKCAESQKLAASL